ncbi:FISUMP domain-containing protein [Fibrobacter intestinalis]|nr:FISUMP domain-containing protein [Fibrobacter intestinalis]
MMSVYDAENNTLTDLRDNKVYKTVTIGEQIWMAENLNYKYMAGSKSFCYNDSTKYCNLYGRLYTYDVKKMQICPEGWHLPDSVEWKNLIGDNLNESLKADSSWRV